MKLARVTTAIAFSLASMILGCSSAEPAVGEAPARESTGYGYEFAADKMSQQGLPAPAQLTPSAVEAGRLAPELIQDTIRAGSASIARCYKDALAADAALTGDISVRFSIGADGAVDAPKIEESSLPAGAFSACVTTAFGAMRFPTSSGGTATVIYPIHFAP